MIYAYVNLRVQKVIEDIDKTTLQHHLAVNMYCQNINDMFEAKNKYKTVPQFYHVFLKLGRSWKLGDENAGFMFY